MPIEFPCDGCQQKLRVPDNSAGKQAKCPNCARILTIPASQTEEPAPAAPTPSNDPFDFGGPTGGEPAGDNLGAGGFGGGNFGGAAASHQNPYASPAAASQPMGAGGSGALSVQPMDPSGAVSIAWELFKLNFIVLIGAIVTQFALNFGITIVSSVIQMVILQATGDPNTPALPLINGVFGIINQVVQIWIGIGLLLLNLSVARGQKAELSLLFTGGPYLLSYIGLSILFGIGMTIGLILLIVPGIYFALTYWSTFYFLVDRNCGVFEAFRLAGEHAKGNRANAFIMGLISMGLSLLGLLACGVGLIVAAPVVGLMFTICYLQMSGQPVWQPRVAT